MNYAFIDFEFSNSYNNRAKICEFGYLICDSNFNILEEDDILINPGKGGKFQKTHRGDFRYAHSESEYYKNETYPKYYELIKNIFTENVVIGFSVDGDIDSIKVANEIYSKIDYKIKAYDVQRLLPEFRSEDRIQISLENAARIYLSEEERYGITPHNPQDDAYITYLLLKKYVALNNISIDDALSEFRDVRYSSVDGYGGDIS